MRNFALSLVLAALLAPVGCQSGPDSASQAEKREKLAPPNPGVEAWFTGPDHQCQDCLKDWGKELALHPDGILYVLPENSRLHVFVPAKNPQDPDSRPHEPYHVHLLHRVGDKLLDSPILQSAADGAIDVDLSKFAGTPEVLIVTSAPVKMKERPAFGQAPADDREKPLCCPYTLAFKLLPESEKETVTALQTCRYEWSAGERAKGALLVQPFDRFSMLVTEIDLLGTMPYVFSASSLVWTAADGFLSPRITVDVLTPAKKDSKEKTDRWYTRMRAGTYHVPPPARDQAGQGTKPFAWQVLGKSLVAFDPPASVELALEEEKPATTAHVTARFGSLRPNDSYRFMVGLGYPIGTNAKYGLRLQTDDLTADKREAKYACSVADLDPSSFPFTGFISHRLQQPLKIKGGLYRPAEPLGRSTIPLPEAALAAARVGPGDLARLHASMIAPVWASHYSSVRFFGSGATDSKLENFLAAYWANGGPGTGSGTPGPGTGTGGTPDPFSPFTPSPAIVPPPGGGGGGTPGTGISILAALPAGTVGVPYSGALFGEGGTAPYRFMLTGGALPSGLTLSPDGTVSGVPGAAGTFAFTAKVTDNSSPEKSASGLFSILISLFSGPGGGGGGGGPLGGGPTNCKCGPKGESCPRKGPVKMVDDPKNPGTKTPATDPKTGKQIHEHEELACRGQCGNCQCSNQNPGEIQIEFPCKCGMIKTPGLSEAEKAKICKDCKHHWTYGDILKGIAAAIGNAPNGFQLADISFYGRGNGPNPAPCHPLTEIGVARVDYWGPAAFQLVSLWFIVKVHWGPCFKKDPDPIVKKDPGVPGGEGDGSGWGILEGIDPELASSTAEITTSVAYPNDSRLTVAPGDSTIPGYNPSTNPNIVERVFFLVGAWRRAAGLAESPEPTTITAILPTDALRYSGSDMAAAGATFASWRGPDNWAERALANSKREVSALDAAGRSPLRNVGYDVPIILPGTTVPGQGGGQGGGGRQGP